MATTNSPTTASGQVHDDADRQPAGALAPMAGGPQGPQHAPVQGRPPRSGLGQIGPGLGGDGRIGRRRDRARVPRNRGHARGRRPGGSGAGGTEGRADRQPPGPGRLPGRLSRWSSRLPRSSSRLPRSPSRPPGPGATGGPARANGPASAGAAGEVGPARAG